MTAELAGPDGALELGQGGLAEARGRGGQEGATLGAAGAARDMARQEGLTQPIELADALGLAMRRPHQRQRTLPGPPQRRLDERADVGDLAQVERRLEPTRVREAAGRERRV